MTTAKSYKLTLRQHLRVVKLALYLLNRSAELQRLMVWAESKRRSTRARHFAYIYRSYENRRRTAQQKLMTVRSRHGKHYWPARGLHMISNLTSVKPGYYHSLASDRIK
jgi:hypothetical protein